MNVKPAKSDAEHVGNRCRIGGTLTMNIKPAK